MNIEEGRQEKRDRSQLPGGDVVRVWRVRTDLSGEAEVRDLDELGSAAKDVLGLHVAVEEAVAVHEG